MKKRLLFIGMVVLVASAAANAGAWDWLVGGIWGGSGFFGQGQASYTNAGNVVNHYGEGTTSNGQASTYGHVQSSPKGTQIVSVTTGPSASITGSKRITYGTSVSTSQVSTGQWQWY